MWRSGLILISLIFAFAICIGNATSGECDVARIERLRERVEAKDYQNVFNELQNTQGVIQKELAQQNNIVVVFRYLCREVEGAGEEHDFLFERSSSGRILDAEYHSIILDGFIPDKHEFKSEIFISSETAQKALKRYLSKLLVLNTDEVILDLRQSGFFVHSDDINDEGLRKVVLVKRPYPAESIIAKIGGNASPNIPVGFCLLFTGGNSSLPRVLNVRECDFNWRVYVRQANDILTGG
ncbi:hypothetical protein PsW64_01941 [Pseudovibrio sp. W64]|uniref:hypothetical protein n=1 Tax=Pseudovibrio sp. W64 TaxID=1735583 RepID=UPI0007AE49A1|nr:hypothetical protein [Pseudovibrio sp. W64]KZK83774.1 hypothetical protein PsW64_01941 [Pseudovibrio sp. W64]